jgi:tetratricopeptide (TPR) repeat protein
MHDWDWHAAREHALRALQLNPSSPEAHTVYARYLRTAGNLVEALNHRKQAVALDPFRADLRDQLTLERYLARDYQGNVAWARQALTGDPNNQEAHIELCINLGRLRLFDESVAECGKELALEGHADWAAGYAREYREHGYEAASLLVARKQLNETLKRPQPDLWELANAYVLAGMREEALRTLFQGLQTHEPGLLQIRVDPDFDSIRNDPRYADLIRQIGFPEE